MLYLVACFFQYILSMYSFAEKHKAIIHYCHFERSLRRVASRYGCAKSTLARWVKQTHPECVRRRKRDSVTGRIAQKVASILADQPFLTMDGLVERLRAKGDKVSRTTAWRASRLARFTRKRVRPRFSPKQATPAQAAEFMVALGNPGEKISIDETCVYFNDSPRYGYSPKGQRCYHRPKAPKRTGKVTLVLAISETRGVIGHKVIQGSFNSAGFAAFLTSLDTQPGATLILDNAACHRTAAVRAAADVKRARLLFIPPYSPEFNPIENAFSVLKAALRSQDGGALPRDLTRITQKKCIAFFRETRRYAAELARGGA